MVLCSLRDFAAGLSDIDKAIALDPKLATAYANRGLAKCQNGDYGGGRFDLNKAIELDPTKEEFYHLRGQIELKNRNDAEASVERKLKIGGEE